MGMLFCVYATQAPELQLAVQQNFVWSGKLPEAEGIVIPAGIVLCDNFVNGWASLS